MQLFDRMSKSMSVWLSERRLGDLADIISSFSYIILLKNVFRLRSTAGISKNYLIFSMIISVMQLIDACVSWQIYRVIIELILIGATVMVYATVTRMFPVRSERFRDNSKTLLITLAIAFVISLTVVFDGFMQMFVHWMSALRLYCQYSLTINCRRTTHFNWSFLLSLGTSQLVTSFAFLRASFTETRIPVMCNFWLAGIINTLITVDFVFAVFNVRDTPDTFELLPK